MNILITEKDDKRMKVLESLKRKEISQEETAATLGVCTRQVRRLLKRYKSDGIAGIVHKSKGRSSPLKMPSEQRKNIANIIATHYPDFGPTLAAEMLAERHNITREDCDKFALNSHKKAAKATENGWFNDEIMPVEIPQRKKDPIIFDKDEGIRADTTFEKLSKLPPFFKKDGIVTAGNASQITDGASAVVVMSAEKAKKLNLKPLASIKGYNTSGVEPAYVMGAPIPGVKKILKDMKFTIDDIDLVEHNEAFSSASAAVMKEFSIPKEKFNVHGGAVAIGHPIGSSGSRILVTLMYAMKHMKKHRGLATICLGGGNAVQMIIER